MDAKLNSEKLSTTKLGDHVPSGFAMFISRHFNEYKISTMYRKAKIA